MGIKTAQRFVENRFGKPVKELVHELYYKKGMSQPQVAKELGVSPGSIWHWMKDWGWPTATLTVTEIPPLEKSDVGA